MLFHTFTQYDKKDPRTAAELTVSVQVGARIDAVEAQPTEVVESVDEEGNVTTREYHKSGLVVGGQRYNVRGSAASILAALGATGG